MKWLLIAGLNVVLVFATAQAQTTEAVGNQELTAPARVLIPLSSVLPASDGPVSVSLAKGECRVTWFSPRTGAKGHGEWITRGLALAAAEYGNRTYPELIYNMECRLPRSWAVRNWLPIAGFTALQATDAWGTERGFGYGARWHESNPLMPRTSGGRVAWFAATYSLVLAASWGLDHAGHRKLARRLLWGSVALEASAAARTWHSVESH